VVAGSPSANVAELVVWHAGDEGDRRRNHALKYARGLFKTGDFVSAKVDCCPWELWALAGRRCPGRTRCRKSLLSYNFGLVKDDVRLIIFLTNQPVYAPVMFTVFPPPVVQCRLFLSK
jgi:hypothetical protein